MSEQNKNIKPGYKRSASKLIHDLSVKKITRAHMSELSQALMSQFDGADGFAREVFSVYQFAPPAQKVRLMAMMMDLVKNDTLLSGKQSGFDDFDEADLLAEAKEIVEDTDPVDDDGQETE